MKKSTFRLVKATLLVCSLLLVAAVIVYQWLKSAGPDSSQRDQQLSTIDLSDQKVSASEITSDDNTIKKIGFKYNADCPPDLDNKSAT